MGRGRLLLFLLRFSIRNIVFIPRFLPLQRLRSKIENFLMNRFILKFKANVFDFEIK